VETIHKDSEQTKLISFFDMLKRHTDEWNPIKKGLGTKYEDRTDQKEAIQGFKDEWNAHAKKCMEDGVEIPSVVIDSETTKGLTNSVVNVCKEKTIDMSDLIFGDFNWTSVVMKDYKLKFDNSKFKNFTAFTVSNDAGISFYNATFKEKAQFIGVSVNDIDFIGASFLGKTSFFDCEFKGRFNIQWALINTVIEFMNTEFFTDATFENINFSFEESFINELFDNNKFKEKYAGLMCEDELYEIESAEINKKHDLASLIIKNEKNQKKILSISNKTTDGKFITHTLEIKMDNKVISSKLRGCYKVEKNFSVKFKKVKFKNDFRLGDIYNLKNLYLDDVIVKGASSINSKITNCPDFSTCFFDKKYHITDRDSWRKQPNDPNQLNEAAYRWLKNYYNQQKDHERELQYFELEYKTKLTLEFIDNEEYFRQFKLQYKNRLDYESELMYFEKEMNEKYKKLKPWSRGFFHKLFFFFYKYVSNYGNSYIRPLGLFFGISFGLYLLGYYMENPVKTNFFKDLLNGIILLLPIEGDIDKLDKIIVRLLSIPFLFFFGIGLTNRFKNSYIRRLVWFFGISFALYLFGYYVENPVKFFKALLDGMIPLLGIKGEIDKWYEIIVRLLSIPFLFLFGLGLRNRFKLR